jgi:PAS domain S-box-containing protein
MLGYTVEEMLGRSLFDFMDEAARTEAQTYFARRQKGISEQHDFRFIRKDGSNLWTMISTSVLQDAQGKFMGALGMVVDITERKQTEAALRESEQKFRAIFNSTLDSILIADETGCYVDVNPAACALFGLPQEQIVGRQVLKFTELEPIQDEPKDWQSVWAQGQMRGEFRLHLTSSTTREVEYSVIANFLPGRHLFVFHDITERKQAEVALRALSQQEQEKALQLEQTVKKLQYTQAQLVQHEKMASLGQLVAGVAHEINNPTSFIYGNIQLAKEYTQDLLNLLQLYQQHHPVPVVEITQQLEHIDIDFITKDFPKLIASMKEGANRIKEIVLSLRNFSRLDEAECKQVDIHEGIDNTLLILKHRLAQQPHRSKIQVLKDYSKVPKIECYPGQLNQVFMNLLCNAIDALEIGHGAWGTGHELWGQGGQGGELTDISQPPFPLSPSPYKLQPPKACPYPMPHFPCIRIHTEFVAGSWVVIHITDNGPGLTAEVKPKVFDPFFTTKPPGKGTGLGLSISYQIVVEKHGGQLTCHSVPSQGAEFVIRLPVTQTQGCVATQTPTDIDSRGN